ncbi:MAG TPA: D-glycero-beta-D-manno-heptose 1-phosphate adenylyltransferase [Micromonosporaceae bacterium]|nr:D-glycero-beta-D-manno-heptose 1-phosphate adenylyltransferase [Micromonosporaceae bacterium]
MATESRQQERLVDVVEGWRGHGVLVVGDAMLDEWRFAESNRLCREAPAPVLTLRRRQTAAGGAANTAVNLAALGAQVTLVAPVGPDVAGDELHDCLDRAGVRDRTVTQPGWSTPVKRRLLAADQILLREDEGNNDARLNSAGMDALLRALHTAYEELRAVAGPVGLTLVICDYGLGALPEAVRDWLVRRRHLFTTVALDAHDLTAWPGLRPTVVTPSFAEAARLMDDSPQSAVAPQLAEEPAMMGVDRAAVAQAQLAELRERTGAEVVAVTLDIDGTVVAGADGGRHRSHAKPVPASQAVGAGDAYLAAMTLALAAGAAVPVATHLAQLAATATVSGTGTCVCDRSTLVAALGAATPPVPAPFDPGSASPTPPGQGGSPKADHDGVPTTVVDASALVAAVNRHRDDGSRIVFTNGCFDVLHRGHVRYLSQARRLGDVLVVAVNSDESVRRLKGPERPINPIEDRLEVLGALSCVDYVIVFEEDSPATLIEAVRPDVYVKGGDYPPEMVPEAPLVRRLGGEVRTLGFVPDRSTSAIIERIRAQAAHRELRA